MIPVLILSTLVVVIAVIYLVSRSQVTPWLDDMIRLNPGTVNRAEWMAPGSILENVQQDYLAFHEYATETLPKGWIPYMRDLNHYLCGEMLQLQRESLEARLRQDRGRMIDVVRAYHHLEVRHFSGDGLSCILIDHQTDQRLATYDYWSGSRLHTQDLDDLTYIYEMQYDLRARRWKIARFIQTLPPGLKSGLDITLPQAAGRDQ